MTQPPRKGYHRCPHRLCGKQVPDALFACGQHWHELPAEIRREIYRTSSLNLLSALRRAAITAALNHWDGVQ